MNMEDDEEIMIHWDNILVDNYCYDHQDTFNFLDDDQNQIESCSSPPIFSVDDIEQLLLNDDDVLLPNTNTNEGVVDDGFFDDIFVIDSPPKSSSSPSSTSSGGGAEVVDLSSSDEDNNQNQKKNGSDEARVVVVDRKEDGAEEEKEIKDDNSDDDDADVTDPLAKKRKRQLRNKDAALRSRERKKMYVKDLEMKSRYYEAECKRLGSLLQCFMAENQALRFSMHTANSTFNAAPITKQESAVLFLESLLLGSLLWLISIVCQLVVLPRQPHQQSQLLVVEEKHLPNLLVLSKGASKLTLMVGKPFKASRSRMRLNLTSLQVVSNILLPVF